MTSPKRPNRITQMIVLAGIVFFASNCTHAEENTLQRIQREGVIHTGTEPAFEPFEFIQNGETIGYDMDVLHEIAKRMGVKIDQHDMDFNGLLPSLITHKIDMVATSLAPTPERAKKILFTNSIADMTTVIVTGDDNNSIHNKKDFLDRNIGTQQNSGYASYLVKLNDELKEKKGKGIGKITYFQSYPEIFLALRNKTIEATIAPWPIAANYIKKNPGQLKIAGLWSKKENDTSVWAVRLDDHALQAEINHQLESLKNDGTLKSLQEKWFGKGVEEPMDGTNNLKH